MGLVQLLTKLRLHTASLVMATTPFGDDQTSRFRWVHIRLRTPMGPKKQWHPSYSSKFRDKRYTGKLWYNRRWKQNTHLWTPDSPSSHGVLPRSSSRLPGVQAWPKPLRWSTRAGPRGRSGSSWLMKQNRPGSWACNLMGKTIVKCVWKSGVFENS